MPRDVELQIITETLRKPVPGAAAADLITGSNISRYNPAIPLADAPAPWAMQVDVLARAICTRLYGRPQPVDERSPLAQAEDAKSRRDLVGELSALTSGEQALTSAPWYPVRPGDLVHVHYEQAGEMPPFGETYIVKAAQTPQPPGGLLSMELLAHTLSEGDVAGMVGCFAMVADDPLYDLWFEGGPQVLTIVRDGRVVHLGPAVPVA